MAKQRVQVRDLPDAPQLQATVRSGGQYNVAVQQAGRNKLMDLADQLSMVNPALREYGAIQDIDAKNFEDEIQRLDPEEQRKLLTKNRDDFDKLVRKNAIPFLGNAWNWKRKSRAIGALMHDDFARTLQDNFDDPANADLSTDQVVKMTREALEEGAPILKEDMFVREGFQEAINPTVQKYSLHYDKIKNEAARLQIKEAGIARLFRDTTGTIDFNGVEEEWDAIQGSLKPEQLINIIETVARQHASIGNKQDALEWLDYAAGHLKVGTSLMGDKTTKDDDVYGLFTNRVAMLKEAIEDIDSKRDNSEKKAAEEELNAFDDRVYDVGLEFKNAGKVDVELDDGSTVTLSSEEEIRDHFQRELSKSSNPYVKSASGLEVINKTLSSLTIRGNDAGRFRAIHQQMHSTPWQKMLGLVDDTELSEVQTTKDVFGNTVAVDPELKRRVNALNFKYNALRDDKLQELSSGKGYIDVNGNNVTSMDWQGQVTKDMRLFENQFQKNYTTDLKALVDDFTQGQKATNIKDDVQEIEDETLSIIDPTKEIDDVTSYKWQDSNIYDVELAVRKRDLAKAAQHRKRLEVGGYYSTLFALLNTYDNVNTPAAERDKAARSVLFYLMADPIKTFNVKNITKGAVTITQEGGLKRVFEFKDKQAIQDVLGVMPIVSHERLREITQQQAQSTDGDVNVDDIEELLKAIYGPDFVTEKQVNAFIQQQNSLHARFK